MSNYIKSTDFSVKDNLPTGDANKKILGSQIDTEFNSISSAIATKIDRVSGATVGNFASFTISGDVEDSGRDWGSVTNEVLTYSPPVGSILDYAGATAPSGWLICDGGAVSRTTYAALFAVIGTTFGAGDGSTTFNLPDLRGRTSIGVGQGTGLSNRTRGSKGGSETHKLTVNEMPKHNHGGGEHDHSLKMQTDNDGSAPFSFQLDVIPGVSSYYKQAGSDIAPILNQGGDEPHNNMQPFLVLNKIIKT